MMKSDSQGIVTCHWCQLGQGRSRAKAVTVAFVPELHSSMSRSSPYLRGQAQSSCTAPVR
ncbi:hypothetical protein BN2476_460034 [Paraburkholderia piptadeniae]|uniref:Uncharacterized protein n=1 Tax=Paraburkholderia piptadeniae TaxID=1701573 RepID=A0A1N7SCG8_9BURK|nr:hypothetical protein BN2476_460034 [Paraburkholderia piptadeniae]